MKKAGIATLTLLLVAGAAMAQHGGPGGGEVLVASNGTVFITSVVRDSATETATTQIVAVTTSGAKAWTATLANGGRLTLSGNNLLSVSDGTITAINTATGATAWTLTQSGRVMELEPFSGGTYAIVVTPAATSGAAATRSLIAISSSGTVLWSVSL